MKFGYRFFATFFLMFLSVDLYAPSITSQQSVSQQESPELEELIEDAVLEEIARLFDVKNTDRKTIAKKILVLAKKPETAENITFVINYLTISFQQRLGNDISTNALSITNCAKLIIEDLVKVAEIAPTAELKKKTSGSMLYSLSHIAILGCCAYIIKLLFGVYSTLNSVFSVVNSATEAYDQIKATIDSLTGVVSSDGAQTRSIMQSGFEELSTQMHEEVEALSAKNHDEMIELTQKMMLEEKERIAALGAQLQAQHQELKTLQVQASAAQVTELGNITRKLEEAGTRTARTLVSIQDSMLKIKSAQQKQQQAQFKKLEERGFSTETLLREMQRENRPLLKLI